MAWAPLLAALALGPAAAGGDATPGKIAVTGSEADLALTKTASPGSVPAGGELTYTLTVTSAGPQETAGVLLVDTLPSAVTLGSATASLPFASKIFADGFESGDLEGWTSGAGSQACSESAGTVTCDLEDLPSGGHAVVTLVVSVSSGAAGETLTNTAVVSADEPDPDSGDNTASVDTMVDESQQIDLGLEIVDAPDPVAAGGVLSYTLTVTNAGPGGATGVTLEDFLPFELSLLAALPSQGTCALSANVVTCELGSLGAGATASATILTRVAAGASIAVTNPAAVFGAQTEANPADNTATAVTTIGGASVSARGPAAGDPIEIPALTPAGLASLALLLAAAGLRRLARR